MATETTKDEGKARRRLYRLSVDQFLTSIRIGVFPHGPRLELLAGILVAQLTRTDPHDFVVDAIGDELRRIVPGDWSVREEKSLTLGRYSRPTPDLSIVKAPRSLYAQRAPTEKETALVVEVSESTYRLDRGLKWRLYASAGIPFYWVVNLAGRQIEICSNPAGRGRTAAYLQSATFGPDDKVPILIGGLEAGQIVVKDLLP